MRLDNYEPKVIRILSSIKKISTTCVFPMQERLDQLNDILKYVVNEIEDLTPYVLEDKDYLEFSNKENDDLRNGLVRHPPRVHMYRNTISKLNELKIYTREDYEQF